MLEYDWHAKIISGNRVTIPDMIVREWELTEGDVLLVSVKKPIKQTRDVIL